MNATKIVLSILLATTLVSCSTAMTPSETESPVTHGSEENRSPAPLTQATADEVMSSIVAAINQEDGTSLILYQLERDRTEANVRAAIADYKAFFNNSPITQVEAIGQEQLGQAETTPIQRFNYRLSSNNGQSFTTAIYQDQFGVRVIDPFFLYSYWAKGLTERLTTALKTEDAAALAKVLNPEDGNRSVDLAEGAIATYRNTFDLNTVQTRFKGFDAETNQFVYVVYGLKANTPIEHEVNVRYGDGLVGLNDSFVAEQE